MSREEAEKRLIELKEKRHLLIADRIHYSILVDETDRELAEVEEKILKLERGKGK